MRRGRWRFLRPACLALGLGAAPIPFAPASAADPSGTAVAVLQSAEADGNDFGRRVLAVQSPVFMGDKIVTGPIGEAQLRFRDETRLVVGANAQLVIDAFVFKNDTPRNVSISAVRGAFRFITGSGPKQAYAIHTPTATMAVRGTKFDFSVGDDGQTNFVLYEGSVRLCSLSGRCIVLSGGCSVAVLAPHRPAQRVTALSDRAALLASAFPYLNSQNGLRDDFRVDTSSCLVRRAEIAPKQAPANQLAASPSLATTNGGGGSGGGSPGGGGSGSPGGGGGSPGAWAAGI